MMEFSQDIPGAGSVSIVLSRCFRCQCQHHSGWAGPARRWILDPQLVAQATEMEDRTPMDWLEKSDQSRCCTIVRSKSAVPAVSWKAAWNCCSKSVRA